MAMSTDPTAGAGSTQLRMHEAIDGFRGPEDDPRAQARTLLLLRDYWAAIDGKDVNGLRGLMSDDVVIELPFNESGRVEEGFFRVYQGIDEVMSFWSAAFSAEGTSEGLLNAEVHMTGDGRVVFIEGYGRVTMTNGRDYCNRYVFRIKLDHGKVVHVREYYNPITSACAFGRKIADHLVVDALPERP
jgi:ketosteroid isomerase-like protein